MRVANWFSKVISGLTLAIGTRGERHTSRQVASASWSRGVYIYVYICIYIEREREIEGG